ncbi:MAG TPA: polysaccharide pyruvyl transferase family protein, partial [Kofleriaceae bacterium]|nr:polysaccharide pyruvyl transferase family protein [Kofleriaceae bacterium]
MLDDILGSQALCESFAAAMGIAGAETLFYCGGENLFSYGRPADEWKLLGRVLPLLVAHARCARLIGLGATFGPFESALSLGWARRLVDAAALLVVRDARSLRLVEELCGPRAHVRLGLDSAFFVPGLPAPERPPTEPVQGRARVALVPRLDGMGLRVGPTETTERTDALKAAGTQETDAHRLYVSI